MANRTIEDVRRGVAFPGGTLPEVVTHSFIVTGDPYGVVAADLKASPSALKSAAGKRRGRPSLGDRPMTGAEGVSRHRAAMRSQGAPTADDIRKLIASAVLSQWNAMEARDRDVILAGVRACAEQRKLNPDRAVAGLMRLVGS